MKSVLIHIESRGWGNRDGGNDFLRGRGVMVRFSIEGGREGGITGVGLSVGNCRIPTRYKVKDPSVIRATIHRAKTALLIDSGLVIINEHGGV